MGDEETNGVDGACVTIVQPRIVQPRTHGDTGDGDDDDDPNDRRGRVDDRRDGEPNDRPKPKAKAKAKAKAKEKEIGKAAARKQDQACVAYQPYSKEGDGPPKGKAAGVGKAAFGPNQ